MFLKRDVSSYLGLLENAPRSLYTIVYKDVFDFILNVEFLSSDN